VPVNGLETKTPAEPEFMILRIAGVEIVLGRVFHDINT